MIRFQVKNSSIKMTVEQAAIVPVGGDTYEGAYEIKPTIDGQVLPTKYKTMRENLTIKSIPRYDVNNLAGGTTIYIANEV